MATSTTAVQTIDVVTPAAGESVTEGTILEWRVKLGDFIKVDDTIVEISTDKVDVELPAPASGTVSEILVEEGDTVTVGQVIARISLNGAAPAAASTERGRGARFLPSEPLDTKGQRNLAAAIAAATEACSAATLAGELARWQASQLAASESTRLNAASATHPQRAATRTSVSQRRAGARSFARQAWT